MLLSGLNYRVDSVSGYHERRQMIQEKCTVVSPYVKKLAMKEADSFFQVPREITLSKL